MPSSQLTRLTDLIEAQDTDHFGKFYMYVSLLNTMAVRRKSFSEALPKYDRGMQLWQKHRLNFGGELPVEFSAELKTYTQQFANPENGRSKAIQEMVWTYFRKGKISDLVYVVDQMVNHLNAIQFDPQNKNHQICEYIQFYHKKAGMIQFLNQISDFNHNLLAISDSSVNAVLCLLVVTVALALMLSFSLIPSIIGASLLAVGTYGAYHYITKAKSLSATLPEQLQHIGNEMKNLPKNDSFFDNKNYASFYVSALMPMPYAAVTVSEQVLISESDKTMATNQRANLDRIASQLSM